MAHSYVMSNTAILLLWVQKFSGFLLNLLPANYDDQKVYLLLSTSLQCCYFFTYTIPDAPLGIDDLATVHNDIYSCRAKWYDIGLQLRVDVGTLESFKVDHQGSGNQLREVINAWLTSTTSKNPTWRVLAETLSKAAIGEAKLAKELQQKYCSSGQPPVHGEWIHVT